jgi:hypothetical protein
LKHLNPESTNGNSNKAEFVLEGCVMVLENSEKLEFLTVLAHLT